MTRIDERLVFLKLKDPGGFLSNFWPCEVSYEGYKYPSSEHAYQAQKYEEDVMKRLIRDQPTPFMAAQLGRRGRDIKENWLDIRVQVMREILWAKFSQNLNLAKLLKDTGSARLIEGMDKDEFWGWGAPPDHQGENMLGALLMETRDRVNEEIVFPQMEMF